LTLLLGCSAATPPAARTSGPAPAVEEAPPTAVASPALLVGTFRRGEIVRALPSWGAAVGESHPDPAAAAALVDLPPGPRVVVLFGSWCGDSRRELARLWAAFDLAGGEPSVEILYVGVDRAKHEPATFTAGRDLRFVPTFIVERDGSELGRVVEVSPGGIERDLLDLLTGARAGLITARTDLGP
jgi:hypothetical protein